MNRSQIHTNKVAIIGTGFVGSTFAYSLMLSGVVSEMVLIDVNKAKAEGEAMDIGHAMSFAHPVNIVVGDYADCADADVVVIAAGAAQKAGQSRLAVADANAGFFKEIIPELMKHAPNSILVIVSNPVDVLTYVTLKISGLPSHQVLGSGTILDTSRFRFELARKFSVDPRNVHAFIIGEHGDSELAVWSLSSIAGMRLCDYCSHTGTTCSLEEFRQISQRVKDAAYQIIGGKGATYYGIAQGTVRIVQSILRDENSVLTVSGLIDDYYGVGDVCLSLPAVINRRGIREIIALRLAPHEIEAFKKSAEVIKGIIRSVGF